MIRSDLDALFESLSNWGRWGRDDERGMLNHLLPEHAREAAADVREGLAISLAHDLDLHPTPETPVPAQHHMLAAGDARKESGIAGYEAARDFARIVAEYDDQFGTIGGYLEAIQDARRDTGGAAEVYAEFREREIEASE